MNIHEKIETLMKQAEQALRTYEKKLESDEIVEMQEFEKIVKELCALLEKVDIKDAQHYAANLEVMMGQLQALSETLHQKKEALKEQIMGLDVQSRAQVAYTKASGYDMPKDKE